MKSKRDSCSAAIGSEYIPGLALGEDSGVESRLCQLHASEAAIESKCWNLPSGGKDFSVDDTSECARKDIEHDSASPDSVVNGGRS